MDADTLIQDDPQLDPNADGGNDDAAAGGGSAEPFFKFNDRQVYNTPDDLRKSMEEAAKMGATFGELKKVFKEYGLDTPDPRQLKQLFGELVSHRSEKAKVPPAKPAEPTASNGKANVDPKVEEARKWLQENAGMVTKDQFEALTAKLDALVSGNSAREEESRNALISEGQEAVNGWLKDAKTSDGKPVDLNDDEKLELEETIAAWVNASKDRIEKFYKGGNTSLALIKEGYTKVLPIVRAGAVAFPNPASKIAANGKTKTELMNRNPKTMPRDGSAPTGGGKKPERIGDASLHKRVSSKLAALLAGDSD